MLATQLATTGVGGVGGMGGTGGSGSLGQAANGSNGVQVFLEHLYSHYLFKLALH